MDSDLQQAKQFLSARLLRAGLRGRVVAMAWSLRVRAAVAAAGHNVHAVGIGRKVVDGRPTDRMAVRLYVVQKLAPSLLPPRDRLPEEVDGVPTDVIESSPAFLMAARRPRASRAPTAPGRGRRPRLPAEQPACTDNRRDAQRPLVAGISVAHHEITAGTLGYFCRSIRLGDDPGAVHILSNNHVLADVNQGRTGDDVYQPGPADGGTGRDHIAELRRLVPIDLEGRPNRVDAAIAALLTGIGWRPEVCTIGAIAGVEGAGEGAEVRKHGRTTGYTEGVVTDASYDALVGMDHNDPSVVAIFQDQMRIEATPPYLAFGLGGDSGSLVVSRSAPPRAVGLYFAGPSDGGYGIANHIADVLTEMQIELLTEAAVATERTYVA